MTYVTSNNWLPDRDAIQHGLDPLVDLCQSQHAKTQDIQIAKVTQ